MNDDKLSNDQTRVMDIMAQIKKLNAMIDLHQTESKDTVMVSQYKDMKQRFLLELKEIMSGYQIDVQVSSKH